MDIYNKEMKELHEHNYGKGTFVKDKLLSCQILADYNQLTEKVDRYIELEKIVSYY